MDSMRLNHRGNWRRARALKWRFNVRALLSSCVDR